jgi:putative membrane protein
LTKQLLPSGYRSDRHRRQSVTANLIVAVTMAAIAFSPILVLPARVTLAKGRAHVVAVRAASRPTQGRVAPKTKSTVFSLSVAETKADSKGLGLVALTALTALALPEAASAAVNPVASAFAAYGHYLSLVLVVASLTTEKFLVKPGLTEDDAQKLVIADSVYGVAGVLVLYTGYLRVTEYGKGWEYYAHEPIFWVKMGLFAVMGSSSLFCTTKIVQMAIAKTNGETPAVSEKLANRMQKIITGELLAIGSIPLAAALMARGVGYSENMPWQAGAAPVALVSLGLSIKYLKEAFQWSEEVTDEA